MAQTKRKRRRKHRGTQGGKIDSRPRGRPRNRAEARQQAAQRRAGGGKRKSQSTQRPGPGMNPPSWGRAVRNSILIAGIFFAVLVLLLKEPVASTAGLAGFMLVFYVPMSYYLDKFMYDRRRRKEEEAKMAKAKKRKSEDEGG